MLQFHNMRVHDVTPVTPAMVTGCELKQQIQKATYPDVIVKVPDSFMYIYIFIINLFLLHVTSVFYFYQIICAVFIIRP